MRSARSRTWAADSSPVTYSARAALGEPRGHVEQQGRLADAGLAGQQHHGARHQAAAEHPVELVDAGRHGPGGLDVDLADRPGRRC